MASLFLINYAKVELRQTIARILQSKLVKRVQDNVPTA